MARRVETTGAAAVARGIGDQGVIGSGRRSWRRPCAEGQFVVLITGLLQCLDCGVAE
jgi:hypothetical protein